MRTTSKLRTIFPVLLLALGLTVLFTSKLNRTAAASNQRQLSFAERVVYQRAIEEVYWQERLWPADNPQPKPKLDAVLTTAQLEAKVADYLRKSAALEAVWQRPVTGAQLQAELERIAKDTRRPAVLRALYQALDNDPLVIAECLARPVLVERLIRELYAQTKPAQVSFEQWWAQAQRQTALLASTPAHQYQLQPVPASVSACTNDTWRPMTVAGAPTGRIQHTAVWTGAEMIVWGGTEFFGLANTGGRYNPTTDSWTPTSTTGAPQGRRQHTAVWTGTEMIVWGGLGFDAAAGFEVRVKTGGRYNPASDSWTATNSTTNTPGARNLHSAVWTGSEMIVWGGYLDGDPFSIATVTGGRYNPSTDIWTPTSTTGAQPFYRHTNVWTGNEMIIWGLEDDDLLAAGQRYNPSTNTWQSVNLVGAPVKRDEHTAIWTGREMIIWGGQDGIYRHNTGGRYNPVTDSWQGVSLTLAPEARDDFHSAVWTGAEMIIWGGVARGADGLSARTNTGGRYNPSTDSWTPTSLTGTPTARYEHTAFWTGSEMLIWGGNDCTGCGSGGGSPFTNTGGAYCVACTPPTLAPSSLAFAANGGGNSFNVGGLSGCGWTATSSDPAWLTITEFTGSGTGTVNFTVAANAGNTPRSATITLTGGATATVYQGVQFNDVPVNHSFYSVIGKLSARGITSGCSASNFCPDANVTREQMAAFIIRALHAPGYVPPAPTMQRFSDIPLSHTFAAHIEELAARQITLGCGGGNYCPTANVTREQMAAFLIRALHPPGYVPAIPPSQRFADVPPSNLFYAHIEEMAVRGITLGCGGGNYCPTDNVTRAQMAAFLVRAFDL